MAENDSNVILDYDEIANLDDAKLEEAKKKFQDTAYTMVRDVTPVVGELQSYKYAMQDAETLAKAARSEEGYDDMTPIEALGYAGLTALGVAGTIPLVGPVFKYASKGIRSLMPKRGTPTTGAQATDTTRSREQFINMIRQDPGFNYFVSQLPQYRQGPSGFADNYREYMDLPESMRLTYRELADAPQATSRQIEDSVEVVRQLDQTNKNQKNFDAKVNSNSSKALTVPQAPLTFGKGLRANQDDTTRSYLGSAAFDEVNRSGNAVGTPQEWLGYLKGLRNKGIKAEELADSGLVIFGKGGEPVGGDIYNLLKENPKTRITKQEILSALESNPAYRMKIKDYKYPINTEEVLNIYPTFAKLSRDVESMILRNTTEMSNVQARSQLNQITDSLNTDRIDFNDLASSLSASPNKLSNLEATKVRLENSLNQFKDNDKILVRALIDEYDKAIGITSKATEATSAPKHKGTFPGGGYDYKEKLLYLDESIPGNSVGKRVYSVHFNDPNNVTFVRYDTRGIDNYGDTYFMVELQSDPHQSLTKAASDHYKANKAGRTNSSPLDMMRKNPYSKNIRVRVKKREIQDLLDEQTAINKVAMDRPLAPPELERLDKLMKEIKIKERELNRMPARQGTAQTGGYSERGELYDTNNKTYDYFPMGNEATWVKSNIKSLISDARKEGKRYIALAPADFFQLSINNKQKIEQFYGLGNKQLNDEFIFSGEELKKIPFDNSDGSGMGRYRDYKTDELKGMAVVPKAMQDVAKEIGGTFTTKKVYHTDPNKPYKLYSAEKKVPAYAFEKEYQMNEFFDNLDYRGGLEKVKMDADDPRNFVESVVIDLQGTNKKAKMKAYKLGGFVQVDRSNFAPLF